VRQVVVRIKQLVNDIGPKVSNASTADISVTSAKHWISQCTGKCARVYRKQLVGLLCVSIIDQAMTASHVL